MLQSIDNDYGVIDSQIILLPVNLPNHWILSMVDFRHSKIFHFNSFKGYAVSIRKATNYIRRVLHSIIKKYGQKVRRTFREVNSLVENVVICQKQKNRVDCGVYV